MQMSRERFGCFSRLPYCVLCTHTYSWPLRRWIIIHADAEHSALVGSEMSALAASGTFPKGC